MSTQLEQIRRARAAGVLPWSHLSNPSAIYKATCKTVDYLLSLIDAPVPADARELVEFKEVRRVVDKWYDETESYRGWSLCEEELQDLAERLTTYATTHGEERYRQGVEAAAMKAEALNPLVTGIARAICDALLPQREGGGGGRST